MKKYFTLLFIVLAFSCVPRANNEKNAVLGHFEKTTFADFERINQCNKLLDQSWVDAMMWVEQQGGTIYKDKLRQFVDNESKEVAADIEAIKNDFPMTSDKMIAAKSELDQLLVSYKQIMDQLKDFKSYDDPAVLFPVHASVFDGDGDYEKIYQSLKEQLHFAEVEIRDTADQELSQLQAK
ncbi:MAG: hypothetical protein HY064_13630 [Bacteroidetes bacterium]|nr:hypothetical protein [Bacteroidota bacterium]